jgi:hypothetical protein
MMSGSVSSAFISLQATCPHNVSTCITLLVIASHSPTIAYTSHKYKSTEEARNRYVFEALPASWLEWEINVIRILAETEACNHLKSLEDFLFYCTKVIKRTMTAAKVV